MDFLENDCTFYVLDKQTLDSCNNFCCNHEDLDDFFNNESFLYSDELLGKSYCFRLNDNPEQIVCAFTVSNSSIRISDLPASRKAKRRSKIPYEKHSNSFQFADFHHHKKNMNYNSGAKNMILVINLFLQREDKYASIFLK